jgi:hypothetical protein
MTYCFQSDRPPLPAFWIARLLVSRPRFVKFLIMPGTQVFVWLRGVSIVSAVLVACLSCWTTRCGGMPVPFGKFATPVLVPERLTVLFLALLGFGGRHRNVLKIKTTLKALAMRQNASLF